MTFEPHRKAWEGLVQLLHHQTARWTRFQGNVPTHQNGHWLKMAQNNFQLTQKTAF